MPGSGYRRLDQQDRYFDLHRSDRLGNGQASSVDKRHVPGQHRIAHRHLLYDDDMPRHRDVARYTGESPEPRSPAAGHRMDGLAGRKRRIRPMAAGQWHTLRRGDNPGGMRPTGNRRRR